MARVRRACVREGYVWGRDPGNGTHSHIRRGNLTTIGWAFEAATLCGSTCFYSNLQILAFDASRIAFWFLRRSVGRSAVLSAARKRSRSSPADKSLHTFYIYTTSNAGKRCHKKKIWQRPLASEFPTALKTSIQRYNIIYNSHRKRLSLCQPAVFSSNITLNNYGSLFKWKKRDEAVFYGGLREHVHAGVLMVQSAPWALVIQDEPMSMPGCVLWPPPSLFPCYRGGVWPSGMPQQPHTHTHTHLTINWWLRILDRTCRSPGS